MNNLINNDYLGITNLNSIYADTGNIDTFSCKSLTIGGTDYTSYNNNLQNQITTLQSTDISLQTQINQKVNTSDYGTFNGDVILNQTNTYLSGDTTNFTIKNKYPIYGQNPMIYDSNLLYFYTFYFINMQLHAIYQMRFYTFHTINFFSQRRLLHFFFQGGSEYFFKE